MKPKTVETNAAPEAEAIITPLIKTLKGRRVILDSDLARIYGVETKALNRAVKRNADRFPHDFVFIVDGQDLANLKYQIGTSSSKWGGRRRPSYAFTEHGSLMAATVLSTSQAVAMSIYIIRAFVKLRESQAANAEILKRLAEIDQTLLAHDVALRDLYEQLRPLLLPPPEPPQKEIGFHTIKAAPPPKFKRVKSTFGDRI
jgi:phage regulator Rha-like protein